MDMTYQQLVKIINSAGAWFVGSFMGEFVINYPKFCNDLNRKADFIDYIHGAIRGRFSDGRILTFIVYFFW